MNRYIHIDPNTGQIVGENCTTGIIDREDMILVDDNFDKTNKKYKDGEWVSFTPKPVDPTPVEEPITQEEVNATILLNQATILTNQENTDEVLSQILLNQFSM